MPAIKPHSTPVDKSGAWDGPKAVASAPNNAKVLTYMHAWKSVDGDVNAKGTYKFPHHAPKIGSAAVIAGVNNALARLASAKIPEADRAGVEAHLRKHRKDAGLDEAMSEAEIREAIKFIKRMDDLTLQESQLMNKAVKLQEEATVKGKVKAALNALKGLVGDKTVPQSIHDSIEGLVQAMKKNWKDLENDATAESLREMMDGLVSAEQGMMYARQEMWDIAAAANALMTLTQLTSECDEPEDLAKIANIMRGILDFILGEIDEMIAAAQSDNEEENSGDDSTENIPMGESMELIESAVALNEKAIRSDGTATLKLIQPGWGSSGYYSPEVLKRDGAKAFPVGTKMMWNHPTDTQESQRPEGDLNDLASELVTPARWMDNGPKGAGLYADAKVFKNYQESVNDLAPHIGVSIHARGKAAVGDAEGKRGNIVQQILESPFNRVDYVTMPGAGGEIVSLFEAARSKATVGVQQPASADKQATNDKSVAHFEEADMPEVKELQEANATLQKQVDGVMASNARLAEALALRDAKDLVEAFLTKYPALPDATKTRLSETLTKQAPLKEGALDRETFTTQVEAAIKSEIEYLTQVAGLGRVRGLGESQGTELDEKQVNEELTNSFARLGLNESGAKIAAKGRG